MFLTVVFISLNAHSSDSHSVVNQSQADEIEEMFHYFSSGKRSVFQLYKFGGVVLIPGRYYISEHTENKLSMTSLKLGGSGATSSSESGSIVVEVNSKNEMVSVFKQNVNYTKRKDLSCYGFKQLVGESDDFGNILLLYNEDEYFLMIDSNPAIFEVVLASFEAKHRNDNKNACFSWPLE